MSSNRVLPLESMRGVAAIIVTFYHFAMAFVGQAFPLFLGTPLFMFMNGDAAVVFFFVLSGSVNCRPLFQDPSFRSLLRCLLRRWPRLMLPSLLATLVSWGLYALDLYHFREAAAITGSSWLGRMGNGMEPGFQPSFLDALYQGTLGCFLAGKSNYDPPLWTMHYELLGSVSVMILAPLLARCRLWTGLALGLATMAALAVLITPYYLPIFVCGCLVTFVLTHWGDKPLPGGRWTLWVMLGVTVYLMSYAVVPVGIYAWIHPPISGMWVDMLGIGLQTVGAICLVLFCLRSDFLCRWASGRGAKLLGELSLPIFLLHLPIYFSASCWVLVHTISTLGQTGATALAWVTAVGITLPTSWIFARVDRAGGKRIQAGLDRLCNRRTKITPGLGVG